LMSQAAKDILNGPESFYCERFRSQMPRRDCVMRRHRAIELEMGFDPIEDDPDLAMSVKGCLECEQGDGIYKDVLKRLRDRRNARRARARRPRVVTRKGRPGIKGQIYLALGKRLRTIRQHLDISQERMARILETEQTIISKTENNKPIRKETARKIEEGLERIAQSA